MQIVVRHLSKAYGLLWALRDVSLELRPGDFIALVGPNVAGKTTFLKLLALLLEPTTGEIQLDGEQLSLRAPQFRPLVGLLSPSQHLYENLSAKENLLFFTALYGKKKTRQELEEALDQVGLSECLDHFVGSLSAGMKCRLSLAKWMLLDSRFLLVDEPYGTLDKSGGDLLEAYLSALCQRGGIVVVATHNISRVLDLCSRALILHQGKLIFDEPRQEPWESFSRAFGGFLPRGKQ